MITLAQIVSAIIEAVAVFVVHQHSARRPGYHAMQKNGRSTDHDLLIKAVAGIEQLQRQADRQERRNLRDVTASTHP